MYATATCIGCSVNNSVSSDLAVASDYTQFLLLLLLLLEVRTSVCDSVRTLCRCGRSRQQRPVFYKGTTASDRDPCAVCKAIESNVQQQFWKIVVD